MRRIEKGEINRSYTSSYRSGNIGDRYQQKEGSTHPLSHDRSTLLCRFCSSYLNFEPSVNDNNQIDYVDVHLSWDMGDRGPVGEVCR